MTKLLIYIDARPLVQGYTIREFQWSEKFRLHIYEGRELTAVEFNDAYERAIRTNGDLAVRVRVSEIAPEVQITATLGGVKMEQDISGRFHAPEATRAPEPVTITREPTVEEALAIVRTHAPHRLRGKPGPKTSAFEV